MPLGMRMKSSASPWTPASESPSSPCASWPLASSPCTSWPLASSPLLPPPLSRFPLNSSMADDFQIEIHDPRVGADDGHHVESHAGEALLRLVDEEGNIL